MLALHIATIVCIGLMIGVELAVSAFINPLLWRLGLSAQVEIIAMFASRLGSAMPFWYALSLLLLLVETFVLRHQPHAVLLWASSGIWVLVIVLTVLFLVPINNRLARFKAGAVVEKALGDHHRWDALHRLRVLALAASMVMFLAAILS